MRDIKFRFYSNIDKKTYPCTLIGVMYENDSDPPVYSADLVPDDKCGTRVQRYSDGHLMQYTGLKDENGREIFEGDIIAVRTLHDNHDRYWNQPCGPAIPTLVSWNEEYLRFDVPFDSINFEVIGNIYDNPELTKKEKQ